MKQSVGNKLERKENSDNVNDGVETFWTICPYCYYIYEYKIEYFDCCLRCQNCERAFHAVAIDGPLPQTTLVEGKEQYNVCLRLFQICYSDEPVAVVIDKEIMADVNSNTTVVYKLEDDDGSSTTQRRRVIANDEGTSGHCYIDEFCENSPEQSDSIEKDDRAEQEIEQLQSRIREIENEGKSMADHSKDRLNGESEHKRKSKSGELESYIEGDDDIFVGLPNLW